MSSRVFLSPETELFFIKTHIIHALAENTSEAYTAERLPTSVGNSHRSAGPRPTTLEEDRELFVDFSLISCLCFEIQGMRTYNFFDWVSNTATY